jgi:hydroxymethylbilane synthase
MPIGAYAVASTGRRLSLTAVVVSPDGERAARAQASGTFDNAERLGAEAAERLLQEGAGAILAEIERTQGTTQGRRP